MLAKKTRKILSLALVIVMVISMFPMFAMADGGEDPDACPHCGEVHVQEDGFTWQERTTPATYSQSVTCGKVPHSHAEEGCNWIASNPDSCENGEEGHVCSEAAGCAGYYDCYKVEEHTHTEPGETECYLITWEVKYCERVSDVPPAPGSLKVTSTVGTGNNGTSLLVTVDGSSKTVNKRTAQTFTDLAAGTVSVWVSYTGTSGSYSYAYYKVFTAEIKAGEESVLNIDSTSDFITSYNHIDAKVAAAVTHDADGGNWGTLTFTKLTYTDARDGSVKTANFAYSSDRREYYTSGLYATRDYATFTFTGTGFSGSKTITVYNNEESKYPANTYYNGARAAHLAAIGATHVTSGQYNGYYNISGLSIYEAAQRLCDNYGIGGEAVDFALSPATIKQIYEAATLEVTKAISGGSGTESLAGFKFQLTGIFATAESVGTANPVPEASPRSVELTTDYTGKVLFENLLTGYFYILKEIELPGNYTHIGQLEVPIYKGQTQVTRTYTNTVILDDTGILKVTKNVESNNLAAGVHTFYFKVSGIDGIFPISVDVKLDGTGSAFATIPNLTPGETYTVTETNASGVPVSVGDVFLGEVKILAGSVLSATSEAIVANQTTEVTLLNKMSKPGTLTINKNVTGVDAGDHLTSYRFTVTSTATGSTAQPVTVEMTGASGSGSISLDPGTYTVAEVLTDDAAEIPGYTLTEPGSQTITISDGGNATANFTNTYTKNYDYSEDINNHATLTIQKEDEEENPLAGVGFTLYTDGDCTIPYDSEYTTNADGQIVFSTNPDATNYLEADTYYLKETTPLDGYESIDTVWKIEVGNDGGVDAEELTGGGFFYKIYTWFIKFFTKEDPNNPESTAWIEGEGIVLTVTNTRMIGTLTVTKAFSGIDELPEEFKITVTGPDGYTQELTVSDNSGEGTVADPYTWTLSDLPTGGYTITESGYDVSGYTCTTVNSAGNGTTSATVTLEELGRKVDFTNTYTLNSFNTPVITIPDPSDPLTDIPDPSDPLTDIPDPSDPLTDIPDPSDPLTDIPDLDDPLADAPKTGDGNNVFALIAIMISCAFGLAIINLPRKKRNED